MYIRDIIAKKRQKEILTEEEIKFAVQAYFKDEITGEQMSALITAIHIYGLTENEILYLVDAMAETGEETEFYRVSKKMTDIHVLGGMDDKVILALICIIHSLGYPAMKAIGRELGMEDRLLSIPGYKIQDDVEKIKEEIELHNIGILKRINNLAPVEEKFYKLRYEIDCENDMGLLAVSILSQKIALGFYNLFFEITYGKNAYVKTFESAKVLARYLMDIGNKKMRNVGGCITSFKEPVGKCFGNLLEIKEIYDYFNGEENDSLEEVLLEFGSVILNISGYHKDLKANKKIIKEKIKDGSALRSFKNLIAYGGGNIDSLKEEVKVKHKVPVISNITGYVSEIDVNHLRQVSKYLDVIRANETDKLDLGAGIVFYKKVGDFVKTGEILCEIYTNNEVKIEKSVERVKEMIRISNKKIKKASHIEMSFMHGNN